MTLVTGSNRYSTTAVDDGDLTDAIQALSPAVDSDHDTYTNCGSSGRHGQHVHQGNINPSSDAALRALAPANHGAPKAGANAASLESLRDVLFNGQAARKWNDVVGHDEAKRALRSLVTGRGLGSTLGKGNGMLLCGPPGVGKTMLAQCATAAAKQAGFCVLSVWPPDLRGFRSTLTIKHLFDFARQNQPALLVFDELHELFPVRTERSDASMAALNKQFNMEVDRLADAKIAWIGVTCAPEWVDPTVLKCFGIAVRCQQPNPRERAMMLTKMLADRGFCTATKTEIAVLAASEITNGFSGADMSHVADLARDFASKRVQLAEAFVAHDGALWPCEKGTHGAINKSFLELVRDPTLKEARLFGPEPIVLKDLVEACIAVRGDGARVSSPDLVRTRPDLIDLKFAKL